MLPSQSERLEVYVGEKSLETGEELAVFVNSPRETYTLEIVRFASSDEVVFEVVEQGAITQTTRTFAFEHGAGWEETNRVSTNGFAPGVYAVRVRDGQDTSESAFCLRPGAGNRAEVAVLLNTNTWAAYKDWGGASLYTWNLPFDADRPYSEWASFDRPNPSESSALTSSHLFGGELHLLRWFEEKGIPFDCLIDSDLHDDRESLHDRSVLVMSTHPEYWSTQMYDELDDFLDSGGSVLNLGGNVIYWKTEIADNGIFVDKTRRVSEQGLWREVGRPESSILGVRYDQNGYGTFAPYELLVDDHWVLEGLGLERGQLFGEDSLIRGVDDDSGASGWETDKSDEFSPSNGVVLARGTNPNGGGEIFFYDHPGGGSVLSFGSLSAGSAVPVDEHLSGIVMNFLGAKAPGVLD